MNDLVPQTSSIAARPTTPHLTPELSQLLDSASSPDDAARGIANVPALLEEARAVLPALKAVATAKAGEEGVHAVIKRRFQNFPQPERSPEQWRDWWADYYDVLADCSLASLEAGMRVYVGLSDSEFMPKPGKLRELAFTAPSRSYGRYMRATRAIALADEVPTAPIVRADPAEVRAMMADFEAKSLSAATKPQLPSIAGRLAEGSALTPQMRKAMEARGYPLRTPAAASTGPRTDQDQAVKA